MVLLKNYMRGDRMAGNNSAVYHAMSYLGKYHDELLEEKQEQWEWLQFQVQNHWDDYWKAFYERLGL